jgi:hypothetical protein
MTRRTTRRTTPRKRAQIKASTAPLVDLAERHKISRETAAKSQSRGTARAH